MTRKLKFTKLQCPKGLPNTQRITTTRSGTLAASLWGQVPELSKVPTRVIKGRGSLAFGFGSVSLYGTTTDLGIFGFLRNTFTFLVFIQKLMLLDNAFFAKHALSVFRVLGVLCSVNTFFDLRQFQFLAVGGFNILKFLRRIRLAFVRKTSQDASAFLDSAEVNSSLVHGLRASFKAPAPVRCAEAGFLKDVQHSSRIFDQLPAVFSYLLNIFASAKFWGTDVFSTKVAGCSVQQGFSSSVPHPVRVAQAVAVTHLVSNPAVVSAPVRIHPYVAVSALGVSIACEREVPSAKRLRSTPALLWSTDWFSKVLGTRSAWSDGPSIREILGLHWRYSTTGCAQFNRMWAQERTRRAVCYDYFTLRQTKLLLLNRLARIETSLKGRRWVPKTCKLLLQRTAERSNERRRVALDMAQRWDRTAVLFSYSSFKKRLIFGGVTRCGLVPLLGNRRHSLVSQLRLKDTWAIYAQGLKQHFLRRFRHLPPRFIPYMLTGRLITFNVKPGPQRIVLKHKLRWHTAADKSSYLFSAIKKHYRGVRLYKAYSLAQKVESVQSNFGTRELSRAPIHATSCGNTWADESVAFRHVSVLLKRPSLLPRAYMYRSIANYPTRLQPQVHHTRGAVRQVSLSRTLAGLRVTGRLLRCTSSRLPLKLRRCPNKGQSASWLVYGSSVNPLAVRSWIKRWTLFPKRGLTNKSGNLSRRGRYLQLRGTQTVGIYRRLHRKKSLAQLRVRLFSQFSRSVYPWAGRRWLLAATPIAHEAVGAAGVRLLVGTGHSSIMNGIIAWVGGLRKQSNRVCGRALYARTGYSTPVGGIRRFSTSALAPRAIAGEALVSCKTAYTSLLRNYLTRTRQPLQAAGQYGTPTLPHFINSQLVLKHQFVANGNACHQRAFLAQTDVTCWAAYYTKRRAHVRYSGVFSVRRPSWVSSRITSGFNGRHLLISQLSVGQLGLVSKNKHSFLRWKVAHYRNGLKSAEECSMYAAKVQYFSFFYRTIKLFKRLRNSPYAIEYAWLYHARQRLDHTFTRDNYRDRCRQRVYQLRKARKLQPGALWWYRRKLRHAYWHTVKKAKFWKKARHTGITNRLVFGMSYFLARNFAARKQRIQSYFFCLRSPRTGYWFKNWVRWSRRWRPKYISRFRSFRENGAAFARRAHITSWLTLQPGALRRPLFGFFDTEFVSEYNCWLDQWAARGYVGQHNSVLGFKKKGLVQYSVDVSQDYWSPFDEAHESGSQWLDRWFNLLGFSLSDYKLRVRRATEVLKRYFGWGHLRIANRDIRFRVLLRTYESTAVDSTVFKAKYVIGLTNPIMWTKTRSRRRHNSVSWVRWRRFDFISKFESTYI